MSFRYNYTYTKYENCPEATEISRSRSKLRINISMFCVILIFLLFIFLFVPSDWLGKLGNIAAIIGAVLIIWYVNSIRYDRNTMRMIDKAILDQKLMKDENFRKAAEEEQKKDDKKQIRIALILLSLIIVAISSIYIAIILSIN